MAWCTNTGLQAILGFSAEEKIHLLWLFHSALIKHGWSFLLSFRRSWTPSVEPFPCFCKFQDDPIWIFSSMGFICVFKFQYKSVHTQMYFSEGILLLLLLLFCCYNCSSQLVILTLSGSGLAKWQKPKFLNNKLSIQKSPGSVLEIMCLNYSIFSSVSNIRFLKLFVNQAKVTEWNINMIYENRSLHQDLLFWH